ncbi:MAG: symmetrical bis(5'-nucleosyl)-tetraphosphatase [Gammaproteobacteria bacterium]|jgi:bis(5'-nucleosyl)-tetraphosphatase (symmetrical)|nr:symmetrical bis(5'-nucleosyl)-tetraphosphatase [Gammaproteobacteria bacterium]MBT4494805.1 symmetrical bis(5'-nucleosyl)-tetraphosphatase [Gammaproteobacteria bacterium]MBT7369457.1 symmetrical bis(5'-nucleosyl)-tetraphosphatase [Gammaproteobacteria bacterium]
MSTYVFGDIQGCYTELNLLLEQVHYDSTTDHLWFVGDLINRGPNNVEVLDLIIGLPNTVCVLGNHDLHFLAVALGQQREMRSDTIADLLASPNLADYIEYLRWQPLIHHVPSRDLVMVHAGLPPQLDINTCVSLAAEVESVLRSENYTDFLTAMYGNEPDTWDDSLKGMDRLRHITNFLTRIRYCTAKGKLELTHKADVQPEGFAPWFSFPRPDSVHVLFGHWAALEGRASTDFVTALDTGCVWGRELMAIRLEDRKFFTEPAQ